MSSDPIDEILEGSVVDGQELDSSIPDSRRPALVRLTLDVESLIDDLMTGFQTRREIVSWSQQAISRTLGELDDRYLETLARSLRTEEPSDPGLVAIMLRNSGDIPPDAGTRMRGRIATDLIDPAYRRAFRDLRDRAKEYVSDDERSSDADHSPEKQRYIAMRPSISELDSQQRRAIEMVLDGRLESDEDIRRWGSILEIASHGTIRPDLIRRSVQESATRAILLGDDDLDESAVDRARELFVARFLLPSFRRGVRSLRGKSSEEPDPINESRSTPQL